MRSTRKRKQWMIVVILLIALALLAVLLVNYRLETTQYTFKAVQVPYTAGEFRVVHLSDLHGAWFGKNQEKLIAAVRAQSPDMIVMTGDMIDRKDSSIAPMQVLLAGIGHLAPIYAVPGNHEVDNPSLHEQLRQLYRSYGVVLLEDEMVEMQWEGVAIYIGGLSFRNLEHTDMSKLSLPSPPKGSFSFLLYHATNQYEEIVSGAFGYQYMFSGHTHGGIIRVPFLGGIVDNDGNFFPEYDSGLFADKLPVMISSRGLGDSSGVPIPRVNNRPEVVCVVFEAL